MSRAGIRPPRRRNPRRKSLGKTGFQNRRSGRTGNRTWNSSTDRCHCSRRRSRLTTILAGTTARRARATEKHIKPSSTSQKSRPAPPRPTPGARHRQEPPLRDIDPRDHGAYKEYWRRKGGVPSVHDFPYKYCFQWAPQRPRRRPQFTFNPTTHTTDVFVTDWKTGEITKQRTDLVEQRLPTSLDSRELEGYNRRKGIGEYTDLTRPTAERWSQGYHLGINANERLFHAKSGPVVSFVDNMLRQGPGGLSR